MNPAQHPNHVVLADMHLRSLVEGGGVNAHVPIDEDQIQPSSIDLRLGVRAWRMRSSFLPGHGRKVLEEAPITGTSIDLSDGAVFEVGCIYLVELAERLSVPGLHARANPKSSTGRIDVFSRLLCDGSAEFDAVPEGYEGPLYLEVSPRTFPIMVRTFSKLSQIRFFAAHDAPRHASAPVLLTIDLDADKEVVGWRARRHCDVIDVDRVGVLDPLEWWEPIAPRSGRLILDPGEFYILVSAENVTVPHDEACEMVAVDPSLGEFRAHYAGFFDPGFGIEQPSRAVLEVRTRDVPFLVRHRQPIGRLLYDAMRSVPERAYGQGIASNYAGQGLRLSKHFRKI